jgi:hypothetical protein
MTTDAEYDVAVQAAMQATRLSQHNQAKSRKKFSSAVPSLPRPLAAIRRRRAEKAEMARRDIGTSNGDLLSFEEPKKLTRRQKRDAARQKRDAARESARLRNRATPVGRWRGRGTDKNGETGNGLSMPHLREPEPRISTQKMSPSAASQMNFWSDVHNTSTNTSTTTTTVSAAATATITGISTVPPLSTNSFVCLDPLGDPFADIANRENNKNTQQLDMLSGDWTMVTPSKAAHTATQPGTTWLDLTLDMRPQKPTQPAAENNSIPQVPQNPFDMFEMVPACDKYASTVC